MFKWKIIWIQTISLSLLSESLQINGLVVLMSSMYRIIRRYLFEIQIKIMKALKRDHQATVYQLNHYPKYSQQRSRQYLHPKCLLQRHTSCHLTKKPTQIWLLKIALNICQSNWLNATLCHCSMRAKRFKYLMRVDKSSQTTMPKHSKLLPRSS